MKTKAFNIWFYAPTMVWFAFSLVTIVGSICSIAMGVGTNNINQDLIIFLKEIVYVVINLLIAVCLSNERTRINIFSFIPITVMLIYAFLIGFLSKGIYALLIISIGLIAFYALLFLLKIKFFSAKSEDKQK